jgi:hypothetical protein
MGFTGWDKPTPLRIKNKPMDKERAYVPMDKKGEIVKWEHYLNSALRMLAKVSDVRIIICKFHS